jgi:hypothetical protein
MNSLTGTWPQYHRARFRWSAQVPVLRPYNALIQAIINLLSHYGESGNDHP